MTPQTNDRPLFHSASEAGPDALPIAETFHSIQGEGELTGTAMFFIRLAGCSVGKPFLSKDSVPKLPTLPIQPQFYHEGVESNYSTRPASTLLQDATYAYVCHSDNGTPFFCDTNFQRKGWATPSHLLSTVSERWISITGGEPLIHDLDPLIAEAKSRGIQVSIETSGTIKKYIPAHAYVVVSPKLGCLPSNIKRANQIRLLVDSTFDELRARSLYDGLDNVWLSPISYEKELCPDNVARTIDLIQRNPRWRLSLQLHKILGVR